MFRRHGSENGEDGNGGAEYDDEPVGSIAKGGHYDVPVMTEEELEAIMENFASEDSSSKTWTRVVVEKFLGNVRPVAIRCTKARYPVVASSGFRHFCRRIFH
jgi:hypothetical protein